MTISRKLENNQDFTEAMERQLKIRVFKHNHMVEASGNIIRFNEETIVIQASMSDVNYYDRSSCEFFEIKNRR